MAFKQPRLTWQKGTEKRSGRWRKMIRGQVFYFDGGNGKSDRDAHRDAVIACQKLMIELLEQKPKQNEAEYKTTIQEWEAVRDWCHANQSNRELAIHAAKKIKGLQKRLQGPRPRPLQPDDKFFDRFEHLKEIAGDLDNAKPGSKDHKLPVKREDKKPVASVKLTSMESRQMLRQHLGISPIDVEETVWRERLSALSSHAVPEDSSVAGCVQRFVEHHRSRVGTGKKQISIGRWDNIRRYVNEFRDYVGGTKSVDKVDEQTLRSFYSAVHQDVQKKSFGMSSGRDRVAIADQFVRWLWKEGKISALPRNLGDHVLTPEIQRIEVFSIEEVSRLIAAGTGEMRLYVLLALNCGMTQKDISDIHPSEVEWQVGTIERKRSKTTKLASTPTVQYKLWPETLLLLKQFRSKSKDRVLLNSRGNPLWSDKIGAMAKYSKVDTIGRCFRDLRDKCGIRRELSFISLKKTCRSLLEDNKEYNTIAELYVGRAPRSISEKHYARPATNRLAEATDWLRSILSIPKKISPDL